MDLMLEDVTVDVGECTVTEQDVWVGEVERTVKTEVSVDEIFNAISKPEALELLHRFSGDALIEDWVTEAAPKDTLKSLLTRVVQALNGILDKEEQEMSENILTRIENTVGFPEADVFRLVRAIRDLNPDHLKAFPRATLNQLAEKIGEANQPIIAYETHPELKDAIDNLQPGEISAEHIDSLKAMVVG